MDEFLDLPWHIFELATTEECIQNLLSPREILEDWNFDSQVFNKAAFSNKPQN